MRLTKKQLFLLVFVFAVSCRGGSQSNAESSEDTEREGLAPISSDQPDRSESSGDASPSVLGSGERDSGGPPQSSDSEADDTDQEMAVEVDNPDDVGPAPKPNVTISVADAAVDDLDKLIFDFQRIEFYPEDTNANTVAFDLTKVIDLMEFQEGRSSKLFEGALPAGTYKSARVYLNALPVANLSGGGEIPVLVGPDSQTLWMDIALNQNIADEELANLMVHVPLWKSLKVLDGDYVLKNSYAALDPSSLGSLKLSGLSVLSFLAICVQKGSFGDLPLLAGLTQAGNSDCSTSAGRLFNRGAGLLADSSVIPFLTPGAYTLDIYLTPGLFIRLPSLIYINAADQTVLNL